MARAATSSCRRCCPTASSPCAAPAAPICGNRNSRVARGYAAACHTYDNFKIIQRAASLGGVESLCSLPVLTSQYGFSDKQLAEAGVTKGMMRLSIGLEDVDDLIADLDQALARP